MTNQEIDTLAAVKRLADCLASSNSEGAKSEVIILVAQVLMDLRSIAGSLDMIAFRLEQLEATTRSR